MEIKIKDNTEQKHMQLSQIPDRLYIDDCLWISTTYGEVKIGIVDGPIYKLVGNDLVKVVNSPDKIIKCHQ